MHRSEPPSSRSPSPSLVVAAGAVRSVGGAVAAPKVVIIVGPTGSADRQLPFAGRRLRRRRAAAGATVVKVYSPNATWAAVKAAVNGANIVIYLGHGNGFPNPYRGTSSRTATMAGA